jgi:hypothetical protein
MSYAVSQRANCLFLEQRASGVIYPGSCVRDDHRFTFALAAAMRDKDPEPALTAEAELKVAATFL